VEPGGGRGEYELSPPAPEEHFSAGGLVVRDGEVLLIRPAADRWQLPKGHIEPSEGPRETAVREVREETGVLGRVVAPLPSVEYWYTSRGHRRIHKRVDYFLMGYVSGRVDDFDPEEVEAARWLSWEDAGQMVTYDNERAVLAAALQITSGTHSC